MFSLLAISLVASAAALAEEMPSAIAKAQPNQLTPEQIAEGWISLFDGQTLFGWEPTSKADWRVENGTIRVSNGEAGWLMTTSQFADFELVVEYRCKPETNSGVFFRSAQEPQDPKRDCFELNIAPQSNAFPTGEFVGRENQRHAKFPHTFQRKGKRLTIDPWDGQWHTIKIGTHQRDHQITATVAIDDYCYSTVRGKQPASGRIGLQFTGGEIEFRNIRLKPRGMKLIFDGKTLAGWNADRAKASHFKVTDDGELRVLNGSGQLESDRSYGDFLLQLDCRVDGDGLNSGVFFRCIPRDMMNGYECQINNKMKDGDPTKPSDGGTGAIYRRQNARRIVAEDHEWFTMTLTANGPHMAAWVNGYQVSDWTDTREPDKNPRKGLRLAPGTLAIQGHDPTTDLRFRKIRIVELPAKRGQE